MTDFVTKDSGERKTFASGMQRDVTTGKTDYTYCTQGPMLERWAQLMERGAKKYERDNWMKAAGHEELERFKSSAMRHLIQWLKGDVDEDHAAAVIFNLNGAEYVKGRLHLVQPAEPARAPVKMKWQHDHGTWCDLGVGECSYPYSEPLHHHLEMNTGGFRQVPA